jgi:hypothetical protein
MTTEENQARAERIIAAVTARGCNPPPRNLRDAAHEAYHAMGVEAEDWHREAVHREMLQAYPGVMLWSEELRARAVEQLVCAALDDGRMHELEGYVTTSMLEALKGRLPHDPNHERNVDRVRTYMQFQRTIRAAQAVLALGDE